MLNQMSNLPSTVGRFYTILPLDTSSKPVFSLPHLDTTGGGKSQFNVYVVFSLPHLDTAGGGKRQFNVYVIREIGP